MLDVNFPSIHQAICCWRTIFVCTESQSRTLTSPIKHEQKFELSFSTSLTTMSFNGEAEVYNICQNFSTLSLKCLSSAKNCLCELLEESLRSLIVDCPSCHEIDDVQRELDSRAQHTMQGCWIYGKPPSFNTAEEISRQFELGISSPVFSLAHSLRLRRITFSSAAAVGHRHLFSLSFCSAFFLRRLASFLYWTVSLSGKSHLSPSDKCGKKNVEKLVEGLQIWHQ